MSNVITKDYTDYFKGRDWVHMLGFYAQDWRKFMTDHNRVFGSGPFFYTTNTFSRLLFHGDEVDCTGLEFHAAYGAWGSHTIEVVEPAPFSVPTMFSEINSEGEPGFNHLHIFVEDLEEAQDACEFLKIPVITVGYPDMANAIEKAKATGADVEAIKKNAGKTSFMVCDMRKELGFAVQLITPRAQTLHNAIIGAKDKWDGSAETMFIPLGGK